MAYNPNIGYDPMLYTQGTPDPSMDWTLPAPTNYVGPDGWYGSGPDATTWYSPDYQNYYQNYWSPDRDTVLQSMMRSNTDLPFVPNSPPLPALPSGVAPNSNPAGINMPAGIDPRLAALYQKYGVSPTGPGTGFSDWQYWQNNAVQNANGDWNYVLGRLESDLAGTGPDAPAGMPQGEPGGGYQIRPGMSNFQPFYQPTTWAPDPRTDELYNMLLGRAQQSLDVNRNDPLIRNQVDAYGAAQERSRRNYLADLAEKGGGTANLGMENRMTEETVGQNTAQFQAQLMAQELSARRSEIQNALTSMGSLLSDQQRLELQNQLAVMDNLLAQASLQQNAFQFDQEMALRTSPLYF